jgi:hypothetical protein
MGGTSTSSSTQSQSGTSNVGAAAQPVVSGLLGQVAANTNNTSLTPAETDAINQLEANAGSASQYAPQIGANATALLNGGGAQNQDPAIQAAFKNYFAQTNPLASNTNYDPMQTPGIGTQLQGIQNNVQNSVNGQFAAAGRDMSGMNQQQLAYGIAQGEAPVLTAQYNANVANQQGAAQNLYNAGNTTTGALNASQAQANANTQTGTQAATDATTAQNASANATLAAEAARRGIPVQALGLLAQIGVPLAGLSSSTTGTGTTNGTATESGAQQFNQIATGIGSMIPKAPTTFNF